MTDFDKLREAAEEIKLDDLQKQRILEACKGKKRKKINYAALATVAAVLVITVVVFSPGFLLKAGAPADNAANEMEAEDFYYTADEDIKYYSDTVCSQNSGSAAKGEENGSYTAGGYTQLVFNAKGFRSIYSTVSQHFIALVDYEEYVEWSSTVTEDDGMAIAQFVEHFGVSKEEFDEANRSYAKYIYDFYGVMPLYCTSNSENEKYEIFNTELIYTSDRKAIDEYYKASPEFPDGAPHSSPAEIIVPEEYYK